MERRLRGRTNASEEKTSETVKPPARRASSRAKKTDSPVPNSPSRRSKVSPVKEEKTPVKILRNAPRTEIITSTKTETRTEKIMILEKTNRLSPSVSLFKLSANFVKPSSPTTTPLEDSGDMEVSKLTYNIDNLTPEPSQHSNLTPTLTEKSDNKSNRHSISRSVSRSVYDDESDSEYGTENTYQTFIEQKKAINSKAKSLSRQLPELYEYGRFLSLTLLLLIPIITVYLTYSCSDKKCSLRPIVKDQLLSILKLTQDVKLISLFVAFSWIIALLSLHPLGRFVRLCTERGFVEYSCNGFITAVLTISFILISEYYYKYLLINLIYQNILQLCILSIIYGFISAFVYYFRSKILTHNVHLNPYGTTGKFLIDFFAGREVNVKIFKYFDLKLIRFRISIITLLIFNLIIIFKTLKFGKVPENGNLSKLETAIYLYETVSFKPIALLTASLITLYGLDLLMFEHHFLTSFEIQSEGVGANFLNRYAVFPFLLTSLSKYTLENEMKEIQSWAVALIILGFVAGIYIKRSSDKLKYDFRLNPMNPHLANLDTIPTFQGKRLLISGLWGKIRHPNHLGELVTFSSLLSVLYYGFAWPPFIAISLLIVMIIHRSIRVDNRNSKKYQSSYQRYCARVKYLLVPKVF